MSTAQSLGGKAKARRILQAYLDHPHHCLFCGNPLLPTEGQTLSEVKVKKFCNNSCASRYNNPRRAKQRTPLHCQDCGDVLPEGSSAKYCSHCRPKHKRKSTIPTRTKGELFASRKNWGSARSEIGIFAMKVYKEAGKPLICAICGYSNTVEICHIIPVAQFADEATIGEINALDNLVALCPNHHWEFDAGLITLK